MEKRLFLAVVVSFFILYGWASFVQKPNQQKNQKETQAVDNKKVIDDFTSEVTPSLPPQEVSKEETATIENKKLRITFSSVGGSIKEILIKEYNETLPIAALGNLVEYSKVVFSVKAIDENVIEYFYSNGDVSVTKKYSLEADDFILKVENKIKDPEHLSKNESTNFIGVSLEMSKMDILQKKNSATHDKALLEYVIAEKETIVRKNNAFSFSEKNKTQKKSPVQWIGFRNRYFCSIIKPLFSTIEYDINPIDEKTLNINFKATDILVDKNGIKSFSFIIFAGPEKLELLKKYGFEFEKIRRYYRWQILDGIAKIIYDIMHFIFRFVHNWGLCVIIMSTIIYFSMYPLTMKSLLSMKKMQALQPKMAVIKEKFANNPQRMNQEIMELYKKNKVNPLGGCLPMLLQMPVFIGLYQVLWRSVDFSGASFLWIKDLSQPDRLYTFSSSLPVIGNEINILPILMIFVMFLQQKLTAKNMTFTDPAQATQQKMMTFILPVFLGMIFYHFASGLTLYFLMFYIFSTITQWTVSQKPEVVSYD